MIKMRFFYLLVLLSTNLQNILTFEKPLCVNSYLSAIPNKAKVYVLDYDNSADVVNVTFFCDSRNSYTHGGLLLNNECLNGKWSRTWDKFKCLYDRACPSPEFFELNGRCHFLGPATTYTRSLEDCSRINTSLAVLSREDLDSTWFKDFIDEVGQQYIWIGLVKNAGVWGWHDNTTFNLASSVWKEGYPRAEADYVYAMIEVKSGKLVNVKDDFTFGNELGDDLRGYKWCVTEKLGIQDLETYGPDALFFQEGTPVIVTIVGYEFDAPLYRDIVFSNMYRQQYQKKSEEEWKVFESQNPITEHTLARISKPMFVGSGKHQKGIICENLRTSTSFSNTSSFRRRNGQLEEAPCIKYKDAFNQDYVRLTLAMKAQSHMSGRYLVEDSKIGIEEHIRVEIVDSEGWTHWAEWGECPNKVRFRRCAKMFHPLTFKEATCNLRYVEKPIDCASEVQKRNNPVGMNLAKN